MPNLIDSEELDKTEFPTLLTDEIPVEEADGLQFYEHHRIKVDNGQAPLRIDTFTATKIKHLTRTRIKNAAKAGYLRVNNKPVKVSYLVQPADEITIILPYPKTIGLEPQNIPLEITYEDDTLLIINKPAGLVCHPGNGNYDNTLINALLYHFEQFPNTDPKNIRPGLVHRLDKDTSGLLVVGKNENAFLQLSRQFFNRTTDRNYLALVWGNIKTDKGTITANIGRNQTDRMHFIVYEDGITGKHAVTHYEVLQRFGFCTLVKCKLETGRTHQIRVHFKHIGHTLFNDKFYGGHRILKSRPSRAFQRFIEKCFQTMPRQALHAKTLGFIHPLTEEKMHFDSVLPNDFETLLQDLNQFVGLT